TNRLTAVVVPNVTRAPGGGRFLGAQYHASLNDAGVLAFPGIVPTTKGCCNTNRGTGIFRADAGGQIASVVSPGDRAPGGSQFRLAFPGVLNNRGQLAFTGDLTAPPGVGQSLAVYLSSGGQTIAVARPGDAMPGGGHVVTAMFSIGHVGLNDDGDVAFV